MVSILRRIGGLRKLVLLLLVVLLGLYVLQTVVLTISQSNRAKTPPRQDKDSRDEKEVKVITPSDVTPAEVDIEQMPDQNHVLPAVENSPDALCNVFPPCRSGQLTYNLSTAVTDDLHKPMACINNLLIFDPIKVVKGLNVVVLNDKEFIAYLTGLPNLRIVFITSYGNIAEKLSSEARGILAKYGVQFATNFKSGNSFVMVGQTGIAPNSAKEKVAHVSPQNPEGFVSLLGCLDLPLGALDKSNSENQRRVPPELQMPQVIRKVIYGDELAHCGLKDKCSEHHVAVSVYSGKNKDDEPKICVNGRFVVGKNLNQAGRGLNIVVINGTSRDVLRVGHFDTYQDDSSTLEIFMEDTITGEIVIVVTFDEAATRLSSMAKQMFYELGSALVQNIKFRASWYFIGQKGISGFSPFEELNFPSGNDWAKPVDEKFCVPDVLDGQKAKADPTVRSRNDAKRRFCDKYDGYEEFCEDDHLDDPISPAPLYDKTMDGNAIFGVPILVIASLAHNSLRLCLETILRQPGVDRSKVLVTYDENYPESAAVANLFDVKSVSTSPSANYSSLVEKALTKLWETFPSTEFALVFDEELLLTADCLYFMAQMLPVLQSDQTLLAVSAWNDNGFTDTSTLPGLVYRIEWFPGMGFLLPKRTYVDLMKDKIQTCCSTRPWDGWNLQRKDAHILVPDVSRVFRRHADGLGVLEPHVEDLLHRKRAYTTASSRISNVDSLHMDKYDRSLHQLIGNSTALAGCDREDSALTATNGTKRAFSLYFVHDESNFKVLYSLCKCFGLYHSSGVSPRGLYKGVLRFSYNQHQMFLVSSTSTFYVHKPPSLQPLNAALAR